MVGGPLVTEVHFDSLMRAAAEPYRRQGFNAWAFARAKIRRDPIYLDVLRNPRLPREGLLLDLGCGGGLMLACLAAANERQRRGEWPSEWTPPPPDLRLYGIEHRARVADLARNVLEPHAFVVTGDIRETPLPRCAVALCLDVLHLVGFEDQVAIVERVAEALVPGGVFLLREADQSSRWGFQLVRWGNRLTAVAQLDPGRRFCFRSAGDWAALLTRSGFSATVRPMGARTPFANVLVEGRRN